MSIPFSVVKLQHSVKMSTVSDVFSSSSASCTDISLHDPIRPMLVSLPVGPPLVASPALESREAEMQHELDASRLKQEQFVAQLDALREASVQGRKEDASSEALDILRSSLAVMASALASETEKRELEEKKVVGLRLAVEESRKAIGRLQADARRHSIPSSPSFKSSLGLISTTTTPSSSRMLDIAVGGTDASPMSSAEQLSIRRAQSDEISKRVHSADLLTLKMPATASTQRAIGFINASGSRSAGLFDTGYDFTGESEKRRESRDSSSVGMQSSSISEDFNGYSRPQSFAPLLSNASSPSALPSAPPSAPLRALGRNSSFAVFDDLPRRGSESSTCSEPSANLPTVSLRRPSTDDENVPSEREEGRGAAARAEVDREWTNQMQKLRIRLAESEESRRATELCVQALRNFIAMDGMTEDMAARGAGLGVILPPLPTELDEGDGQEEEHRPATNSRWSIKLPLIGRRESAAAIATSASGRASPNLTTWRPRRLSSTVSTTSSSETFLDSEPTVNHDPVTSSISTFGSFSFSRLHSKNDAYSVGNLSPKMKASTAPPHSAIVSPLIPSQSKSEAGDESDAASSLDFSGSDGSSPTTSQGSSPFPVFESLIEIGLDDGKDRTEESIRALLLSV